MRPANLNGLVGNVREEVVGWRRHLHENPELSFEEKVTSSFVYETLESFEGLELSRPTETSVVARLGSGRPGRTIALRADMDALPITEETELSFASAREGTMHACGHDGHTAILLGVAKILSEMGEGRPAGELRFVFQHAEERLPGGAKELVEAGVMEGVDAVIGLHLESHMEAGKVAVHRGPALPASDTFKIVVEGEGGHAAWPHHAVDSVVVAAQVIINLQHVVSREVDPLKSVVLSATQISGGSAHNVIPGEVEVSGTVRSFDECTRERVVEAMERIVGCVAAAHKASCSFEYQRGYRPVINDEGIAASIEEAVREALGEGALADASPFMAGDDFSAYQQLVPGVYFFVGAGNQEKGITAPHHHPRFDIDEDSLEIGTKLFVHATLALLNEEKTENGARG
jgi:amidohydrolase